jgi:5-methylcytosine-specific restriction endonuclease McrA
MPPKINEAGNNYGRLTVVEEADKRTGGWIHWLCICTCGKTVVVSGTFLRNGKTRSCGCRQKEAVSESNTTHGLSDTKEMRAVYEAKRRARLRKSKGSYTFQDVERIYVKQEGLCFYCGVLLGNSFHRDHKVPLSRGGTNYPRNIALTCGQCNWRKQNKTASEFKKLAGG